MSDDPLSAAAMEESICLDDDLLSPVSEKPPPHSPLSVLESMDELPEEAANDEGEQLETVTLETSPTTESINLLCNDPETAEEVTPGADDATEDGDGEDDDEDDDVNDDNGNAKHSPTEAVSTSRKDRVTEEVAEPSASAMFSIEGDEKSPDGSESSLKQDERLNISSYFNTTPKGVDDKNGLDFFDHIVSTTSVQEVDIEQELESKERTTSISSGGSLPTEAVPVSFEEMKGSGMKFIGSMQNVSKFFEEEETAADDEAKSFFDTFTAGSGDDTSLSKSPHPEHTTSQPISIPVPQTPPIPNPGSPHPSPLHIALGQRSRNTSQSSPAPDSFQQREPPLPFEEARSMTPTPFQSGEDIFSASLSMSDADRRNDAWIPSEATRQSLVSMVTSAPGTYFPETDQLTKPGMVVNDPQGDPVKDLVQRFMGDQEAHKRVTLTVEDVTCDDDGVRKLIVAECYHPAIDLLGRLLTMSGQGSGQLGVVTKHSSHTLRLWFCRVALMVKLRQYTAAESEVAAFGSLDQPDLYYEFYPDTFAGRRGSMVPFAFRLMVAELPQYLGKPQETLDCLHYLQAIVLKMLQNLENGLAEDGSMLQLKAESKAASRELWQSRLVQILYSIGNAFLSVKDYSTAITVFEELLEKDRKNEEHLQCGIGRIYLQMGDVHTGQYYFDLVERSCKWEHDPKLKCRHFMNKGFVALGQNQFADAHRYFNQAIQADSTNAVAVNNMAVCSLYMGKLKEALSTLETLVHSNPAQMLQEGILFNLCTLYELESSRAMHKKQALLDLVSKHKGNGFNVACLKMT